MDFSAIRLITFDCYGTLIDWETGILRSLRGLIPGLREVPDDQLLEMYGEIEEKIESGPYASYRIVLSRAVEQLAHRFHKTIQPGDAQRFGDSLKAWQPFPDTVAGLKKLATRYKLGIISNIDDDLFAASHKLLQAPFELIVTAQQVRSYKPSTNNFGEMIKRADQAGIKAEQILHAAQSLYHDIEPTNSIGRKNCWVNRRYGKLGAGATKPSTAKPMFEVKSIGELAEKMVPEP